MDRTISFERLKKIALENVGSIRQCICGMDKATLASVKCYLATGETLRTQARGCPNVLDRLTQALEAFIRGIDVRCVGELLELIPKGLDSRLPGWLYGPVEANLGEDGWEIAPAVIG